MMKSRSTHRLAVAALASALALPGCAQQVSADKGGGDTVVLHFATINGEPSTDGFVDVDAFARNIEQVSGGRIKVDVEVSYGQGATDSESRLVEAIASGEIDGGNPATRAFARAGITGLELVEAPMTITSYAAVKELVSGGIGDDLLARLDGSGVIGLGLVVGELRRPFAAEAPLLGPDDWAGARFRTFNSPVQADAVRAFGGEPIDLYSAWYNEVAAGRLDGIETGIRGYWEQGRTTEVGHVTANVVLWPKVPVLSLSQARWDSLSGEQQDWIREAAEETTEASVEAVYDESTPAGLLCEAGVRFYDAGADQITGLTEMLAPVFTRFSDDLLWDEVEALASRFPATEQPAVPEECGEPVESEPDALGPVPEEVSSLPDGLYRAEITLADVEGAGRNNAPGWTGVWTLEIGGGTYAVRCRPVDQPGRDCGNVPYGGDVTFDAVLDAGFVRGTGDSVYFVYDEQMHAEEYGCGPGCVPLPTYRLTWEQDGDMLRFSDLVGVDETEKELKPWQKIG